MRIRIICLRFLLYPETVTLQPCDQIIILITEHVTHHITARITVHRNQIDIRLHRKIPIDRKGGTAFFYGFWLQYFCGNTGHR